MPGCCGCRCSAASQAGIGCTGCLQLSMSSQQDLLLGLRVRWSCKGACRCTSGAFQPLATPLPRQPGHECRCQGQTPLRLRRCTGYRTLFTACFGSCSCFCMVRNHVRCMYKPAHTWPHAENVSEYYWHRLMHLPWFYRTCHRYHHFYKAPTPFDDMVSSMQGNEALGTPLHLLSLLRSASTHWKLWDTTHYACTPHCSGRRRTCMPLRCMLRTWG